MLQFKIIGVIWLVLSLVAAVFVNRDLWFTATDPKYGVGSGFLDTAFWTSELFVEGFLLAGVLIGAGLMRLRRWAAICARIEGVVLLVYCLAFLAMAEFPLVLEAAALFGLCFAGYTLYVVWRFRPYDRPA